MWYETKPLMQGIYLRQMLLIISILVILFGTWVYPCRRECNNSARI